MGYTTNFTGEIQLSRPLTLAEAKELLDIADAEGDDPRGPKDKDLRGLRLQWVPTETLMHIVWDQGEKFYSYVECMQWLTLWCRDRGIGMAGSLLWTGEEAGDAGEIIVVDTAVTVKRFGKQSRRNGKPLTLERLGEMALAQLTNQ